MSRQRGLARMFSRVPLGSLSTSLITVFRLIQKLLLSTLWRVRLQSIRYLSCGCCTSRNEDIAACFEELDKDGNGVLSPDEVISVIQERMGFDDSMARYLVDMFDQNQDGSLDKTEFMHLWTNMFGQHEWPAGQTPALKPLTHSAEIHRPKTTPGARRWLMHCCWRCASRFPAPRAIPYCHSAGQLALLHSSVGFYILHFIILNICTMYYIVYKL